MFEAMTRVIFRPGEFFTELPDNHRLLRGAIWVVLLVAALTALVGYVSTLPQVDALGDPFGAFLIFGLIMAPLLTFLAWVVSGLLARIVAGMEAKPWAVVGYAMTPQIVLLSLLLVVAALFPPALTPVGVISPEELPDTMARMTQEMQTSLLGVSTTIITYLGLGWFLALIYLGLAKTTGQPNKALWGALLVAFLNLAPLAVSWLLAPL
ncbi:MAG: YIP1 family protein [Truepera sp.]|nr:YIP1 family protein [Truepera sp.]